MPSVFLLSDRMRTRIQVILGSLAASVVHVQGDQALADALNKAYMGFDESDDTSPLGVTISMAANPSTYWGNVFCSLINNPGGNTTCYQGMADCKLSASLINHKMMISSTTGKINVGLSRATGYIYNQSMVESTYAKCAYIWDGASNNKYNQGCGDGAPGNSCDDTGSAFHDICPSTGRTCTGDDDEVKRAFCEGVPGGTIAIPRTHDGHVQCLFPGPAIDYHGQDLSTWTPRTVSYLRMMANNRAKFSSGKDASGPNIEKWNEVDLDERLLTKNSIVAFVYVKSRAPIAVYEVNDMQAEYEEDSGVTVPIIAIDDETVIAGGKGPFFAPGPGQLTNSVVI